MGGKTFLLHFTISKFSDIYLRDCTRIIFLWGLEEFCHNMDSNEKSNFSYSVSSKTYLYFIPHTLLLIFDTKKQENRYELTSILETRSTFDQAFCINILSEIQTFNFKRSKSDAVKRSLYKKFKKKKKEFGSALKCIWK